MKTFEWKKTRPTYPFPEDFRYTLLEVWQNEDGRDMVKFWAILNPMEEGFSPIVFNRNRDGYQTILEILSLEDARLAVEKYLLDRGVIEDGDEVIYGDEK